MCIEHNVAGFSNKGPQHDDLVYLAVKVGKKSLCGARFKLNELTDLRPWTDGDRYNHVLSIKEVEFCQPFDLSVLSQTGGAFWGIKYMQASKPILDKAAYELLEQLFSENKIASFTPFEASTSLSSVNRDLPTVSNVATSDKKGEPILVRDSYRVQSLLADIGERMGYKVWLPKNDRSRVLELLRPNFGAMLEGLPLNYDIDTINTIENIDVLWIQGRSIVRAFEVEHTTSIYSGILRMADLMALQPNLSIKAHIVAPLERKAKVMQELTRPVFKHTLAPSCTFISYNSIEELAQERRLQYMSDAVLEAFSESAIESIA